MTRIATVSPIRSDCYAQARRIVFTSGDDWPRMLGAAQTLATSACPADTAIARRVREAYSMHLQGTLAAMAKQNDADRARYGKTLAVLGLGYGAALTVIVGLRWMGVV